MPVWYEHERFSAMDQFFDSFFLTNDTDLEPVMEANRKAGADPIDVAPNQGKLLNLLVRISGARKILEFGALGGYSTIWMAKALPKGGHITTLEIDEECAKLTASNAAKAGYKDVIDIRHAPALDTLPILQQEGVGPFDFIFLDADKKNNPEYVEWCLKLSRVGTVMVFDNVVRYGGVIDTKSDDPGNDGLRKTFEMIRDGKQIDATAIQTVGSKGWDGFALGIVTEPTK